MKTCICFLLILAFSIGAKVNANVRKSKENKSSTPDVKFLEKNLDGLSTNLGANYASIFGYNYGNNSDFKFEIDEGNPDFYARIERPCEIYDTFCIRNFFAEHSKCHISAERVPNPLYRPELNANLPGVNINIVGVNCEYNGLQTGRVEEFYINKATDNLVITIGFDYVAFNGYENILYYRTGKEPFVHADYAGIRFEKMSVTVIIPQLNDLRLDKADISTYSAIPFYSYYIAPGLVPTDPEILPEWVAFTESLPIDQSEILWTEGNFYAATFIQYNICDFGLKIV